MEFVLAHQGNWDEILMFVLPIAIAVGAVKWAERRGARKREELEDITADQRAPDGGA